RNVISGNISNGIILTGATTTGNVVQGNYIGTDLNGNGILANTVSWWRAEGNASDSVDSNSGTLVNGATFTAGKVGQAFTFDGVNALVQAPTNNLPTGSADRSLVIWARLDSLPASEAFFAGYGAFGSGSQTYHLGALSTRQVFFSQWGDALAGPVLN